MCVMFLVPHSSFSFSQHNFLNDSLLTMPDMTDQVVSVMHKVLELFYNQVSRQIFFSYVPDNGAN